MPDTQASARKKRTDTPTDPTEHTKSATLPERGVVGSTLQTTTLESAGIEIPPVSALPAVSAPHVSPAPEYTPTPEEQAWQETYGDKLRDWVEEEGYGIPKETQQLMEQHLFDYLKADEKEQLRVLTNDMERRGLSNTGLYIYKSQQIRANTTTQMARGINEIQIQSSLMKLASFERAMGEAGNYLHYLSQQSQLKYQAKFATWQVQQEAKLMAWQENLDRQKMAIAESWRREGMAFDYQLTSELNRQQYQYEVELTKMTLEAEEQRAKWGGIGNIFGGMIGFFLSWLFV